MEGCWLGPLALLLFLSASTAQVVSVLVSNLLHLLMCVICFKIPASPDVIQFCLHQCCMTCLTFPVITLFQVSSSSQFQHVCLLFLQCSVSICSTPTQIRCYYQTSLLSLYTIRYCHSFPLGLYPITQFPLFQLLKYSYFFCHRWSWTC